MIERGYLRILIAGASGFVGQHLIEAWQGQHHITVLGRNTTKLKRQFLSLDALDWSTLNSVNPNDFDVVINLSGETINHLRWTKKIKNKILQSRIQATEALVSWAIRGSNPNLHFLSASALSIYGLHQRMPNESNAEQTLITQHEEFLCKVANAWEHALAPLKQQKFNLTVMRFAVVLGNKGGAFPKLYLAAKFGLAAKLGSGEQPFAWIAIDDLAKAIDWVIQQKIVGPVNMVAPNTPTQNQLSRVMSQHLHRPYFLSCSAKILRLALGQMADELLLKGPEATPVVLLNSGFKFKNNSLDEFMNQH